METKKNNNGMLIGIAIGIFLTLIYNLPFKLMNLKVSDIILVIATTLAAISCVQY